MEEIMCKCGHSIEEHDEDGCSIMTVVCKPREPSMVDCCKCKLTPDDIKKDF